MRKLAASRLIGANFCFQCSHVQMVAANPAGKHCPAGVELDLDRGTGA